MAFSKTIGASSASSQIIVSENIAYFSIAGVLYSFPVFSGASGGGANSDITVTDNIAYFVYNDIIYSFPVAYS